MEKTKEKEKTLLNATVCFLYKEEEKQILLGLKIGKIGKGRWNGYGGGIEKGESPRVTAVRELMEETKGTIASPDALEKIAIVDFHNTKSNGEKFVCRVHAYLVKEWFGEPQNTKEMANPSWFDVSRLPLDKMMPADRDWLPSALQGRKVMARAYLGPFQKELLRPTVVKFVRSFPDD